MFKLLNGNIISLDNVVKIDNERITRALPHGNGVEFIFDEITELDKKAIEDFLLLKNQLASAEIVNNLKETIKQEVEAQANTNKQKGEKH